MSTFDCREEPIRLYGLPEYACSGAFHRLPAEIGEQVPTIEYLRKVSAGAQARFRTDASSFRVMAEYIPFRPEDINNLRAQAAFSVYVNKDWAGDVLPSSVLAGAETAEKEITNPTGGMVDVTVYFPTSRPVKSLRFVFPDGAVVEAPTPYRNEGRPVVFYGSSITQGFYAGRPSGTYIALLSRWLDLEVVNLGFSGNCRGELPIADYIGAMEMTAFVLDMDHNCVGADMLRERHEPFYRRLREKQPDLPVLMISRPDVDGHAAFSDAMREVIRTTYAHAVAAGEKVRFLNGAELFGTEDRDLCTVDGCHPSDLGAYRMAKRIRKEIEIMLDGVSRT